MSDKQDQLTLLQQAYTALTWADRAIIRAESLAVLDDEARGKLRIVRVYVKRAQDLVDAQIKGVEPAASVLPPQDPAS